MKIMKERVISVDERDAQVWNLITDVPRLKSPWQYVCFVLNVIIPGNHFFLYLWVVGSGTMISSCFYDKWSKTMFMIGVF